MERRNKTEAPPYRDAGRDNPPAHLGAELPRTSIAPTLTEHPLNDGGCALMRNFHWMPRHNPGARTLDSNVRDASGLSGHCGTGPELRPPYRSGGAKMVKPNSASLPVRKVCIAPAG